MKAILFSMLFISAVFGSFGQVAPGNSCATAGCSIAGNYSSTTGSASMGSFSCLGSTPNPNWLAIGIGTNGQVHLQLTQVTPAGTGIDVDFALYGPYTSVSAGCPITGATPTVDCSYSGSATEFIDIANAIAGQVYILLVTNFNGSAGTISIVQNPSQPSSATINCAVNFTATTSTVSATCGQANGSATMTPTGGFAPYTYSWSSPGNPTTATATGLAPGTYTCTITSSNDPITGQVVLPSTVSVTVPNLTTTFGATGTPASCATGTNGTANAFYGTATMPGVTASYQWNDAAAQTTQLATGLSPGPYQCTITLSNGCVGTANVNIGQGTVTHTINSSLISCPGGANGTATVAMTPILGTNTYSWNDPAGQTSISATGLSAGTYTCTITNSIGCGAVMPVTVNELPGMVASFLTQTNPTCNSGSDGTASVAILNGAPNYTYSWDNTTQTSATVNTLSVGNHTVTITDANSCVTTATLTLGEPASLSVAVISPPQVICPESSTTISATGAGGSSPYIYTWFEAGTQIGVGQTITVDPLTSGTVYDVILTETCGSPNATSQTSITFPESIIPNYVADKPYSCLPGTFTFTCTANNKVEIDSVFVDFGNGENGIYLGSQDIVYTYPNPGIYTWNVTYKSIYGCITQNIVPAVANVVANPVADFNFSANPATIFETSVLAQDASSGNVVDWQWTSLNSTPSSSFVQNPLFKFEEGVVGIYDVMLIVTTQEGCVDTAIKQLSVKPDIIMFAPNAFTPDGDEFNQTWKFYIQGIDPYDFELLIFNRWGEVIWETKDPEAEWDGTYQGETVQFGTYVWVCRVKDIYTDKKKEFEGSINIIR